MQESLIASLENLTLDHKLRLRQMAADGIITEAELREILDHAEQLHEAARESHRVQRVAISVLRTGRVATHVYREFGPDQPQAA